MMPAPLSVAIIGCGNIAGGFDQDRPETAHPYTHAGAYRRHGGFRIVACMDTDAGHCADFAARWKVPARYGDLASLIAGQREVDIVSICSPNALHGPQLEAVLAMRPKLVFCEKPLTDSVPLSERIVESYARAGVLLAVNYTRRWAPDVMAYAAALQRGDWGRVRSVSGIYTKGIAHNGSHLVDLLHLMLGPLTVEAAAAGSADHWPDDLSVPALLRSSGGVPVTLSVGDARDYALFEMEIVTEKGTIRMEDGGSRWQVRCVADDMRFKGYRHLDRGHEHPGEYDKAMSGAIANLHSAVTRGAPLACSGKEALAAQRLCSEIARLAGISGAAARPAHQVPETTQ